MMIQTRFTVGGDSHESLVRAATEIWRKVSGEPEADLPDNAFIDVRPETEELSFESATPINVTWTADVLVPGRQHGGY